MFLVNQAMVDLNVGTAGLIALLGYAVVFVTEPLYAACSETIQEFAAEAYPAIIPIPDNQGVQGIGMQTLKQNVEKAVGVDILFNN